MDPNHTRWNTRQKELRSALSPSGDFRKAVPLFLDQHAMVHAGHVSGSGLWSFEDEVLAGLPGSALRLVPPGGEHSIAWILWHLTRVEDVTMNILVAGRDQLFYAGNWQAKTMYPDGGTGNSLDEKGIAALSDCIELETLRAYRLEVGRSTRRIVQTLQPGDLSQKVPRARLEKLLAEAVIVESTRFMLDYWGSLTVAGLLLMPPTRHAFIHLNEAAKIRRKLV